MNDCFIDLLCDLAALARTTLYGFDDDICPKNSKNSKTHFWTIKVFVRKWGRFWPHREQISAIRIYSSSNGEILYQVFQKQLEQPAQEKIERFAKKNGLSARMIHNEHDLK